MKLDIIGTGLITQGLDNQQQARAVLRGEQPLADELPNVPKPGRLPANERRRVTPLIRLAFQAAEDAVADCDTPLSDLAVVFGSSGGDMHVLDRICRALTTPERMVSPTHFHNSVHNAAAGYWSIATQARGPSTCLSAYNDTVGATLLEAASLAVAEDETVLCLFCDQKLDPPMAAKEPVTVPFGAGLVLRASNDAVQAPHSIELSLTDDDASVMADAALDALRRANPVARVLPLLQMLAGDTVDRVVLPAPGRNIAVRMV